MVSSPALADLLRQRTWDKELNVWVGPLADLQSALGDLRCETLDLLDLFDNDRLPIDDDDVRQCLTRALRERLKGISRPAGGRLALVVLSAWLLARYKVGVKEFFDWFCNDFSLVFLVMDGTCSASCIARARALGCKPSTAPAALVDLLMWRDLGIWTRLRDDKLKQEYAAPLSKTRMFPVAFSLRGMGDADGKDSLMRILEGQIRDSLDSHDAELSAKVKLTSAELADEWYSSEASARFRPSIEAFFKQQHNASPEAYRATHGPKKFGQQIVESEIAEGKLRGKFKDRLTFIYDQITRLGN